MAKPIKRAVSYKEKLKGCFWRRYIKRIERQIVKKEIDSEK